MTPFQRLRFAVLLPVGAMALGVRDAMAKVFAPRSAVARSRRAAEAFPSGFLTPVGLATAKHGVEAQLAMPEREPVALVLICHGIGERFCFWRQVQYLLAAAGMGSLVFHYPGYGRSGGLFLPENIEAGARAAWEHLHGQAPGARMFVFGTSLGTAVAAHVAGMLKPAPSGVILSQGFTTLREAAKAVLRGVRLPGALHWLLPDVWHNTEALTGVLCPIFVVHGAADELFPVAMGEALFRCAEARRGGHQRLLTPAGFAHSDAMLGEVVEEYWQPVLEFMRECLGETVSAQPLSTSPPLSTAAHG
jgi:pimeloyl-ACP methyl ester carboxylesterase